MSTLVHSRGGGGQNLVHVVVECPLISLNFPKKEKISMIGETVFLVSQSVSLSF